MTHVEWNCVIACTTCGSVVAIRCWVLLPCRARSRYLYAVSLFVEKHKYGCKVVRRDIYIEVLCSCGHHDCAQYIPVKFEAVDDLAECLSHFVAHVWSNVHHVHILHIGALPCR